tara:strand:- start:1566 stop:2576 length:1011 start_codon:yes stop_codon:yes gene_type:complete
MIKSKIVSLTKPHELTFKDKIIDDKHLESESILCETLVSIISPGTEVAAYTGIPPLRPGNPYPRLLGYCNVARVIKVGANVSSISVGDRVLTGSCHCSHFVILENDVFSVVPDALESRHAACAYLYHLGYDAVIKSDLKYGNSVVVFGLGVLGLGAVATSSRAGAKVFAVSDQPIPSDIAKQLGAKEVFKRENFKELKNLLGDRLSDIVISTSNSWEDWDLALQIAGRNSYIGVIGFPGRGLSPPKNNPLDSQYFYDKQLKIQAVGHAPEENDTRRFLKFNQKDNLSFILSEIERGHLNPDLIISGMFNWDKLEDAYKGLISRDNSPVTYGLEWKK